MGIERAEVRLARSATPNVDGREEYAASGAALCSRFPLPAPQRTLAKASVFCYSIITINLTVMPKNPETSEGGNIENGPENIQVVELDRAKVSKHIDSPLEGSEPSIEDQDMSIRRLGLLRNKNKDSKVYQVNWTGNEVLNGVIIGEHEISLGQAARNGVGMVTSKEGVKIGTYQWITASRGPDHNEQEILVFIDNPESKE